MDAMRVGAVPELSRSLKHKIKDVTEGMSVHIEHARSLRKLVVDSLQALESFQADKTFPDTEVALNNARNVLYAEYANGKHQRQLLDGPTRTAAEEAFDRSVDLLAQPWIEKITKDMEAAESELFKLKKGALSLFNECVMSIAEANPQYVRGMADNNDYQGGGTYSRNPDEEFAKIFHGSRRESGDTSQVNELPADIQSLVKSFNDLICQADGQSYDQWASDQGLT
jgi:hypothetical protein